MKHEFPIFKNYPELKYLDSAATALKPAFVLEAEQRYGKEFGTNAARGLYPLAEKTSEAVEAAREAVAKFLQGEKENVIFTAGTTAGINMLARSLEATLSDSTGEIIVSQDAHHSQILPWQELAKRKNMRLHQAPLQPDGYLDTPALVELLNPETKVLALTLVSNVYGIIQNLAPLIQKVRTLYPEVFIIVDAAQAVAHIPLNNTKLGADALVFSGHKLYGPTGVGVCYLTQKWQERLEPSQFGGGMVLDTESTPLQWKSGPEKFEAGTLPLAQIFGLQAAITFLTRTGFSRIRKHEQELLMHATQKLLSAFGKHITFLGDLTSENKIGLLSFTLAGAHPHDIASLLGEQNICMRAGEHCASFLHRALAIPATTRISFGLYTTKEDIDVFVSALEEAYKALARS